MIAQPSRSTVAIVTTMIADQLGDGHPVGRSVEVDVLAALRLGQVAAERGDDQQHGQHDQHRRR